LRRADDALLLDNSFISREEQMNWVLEQVNRRTGNDGLL
jgi:cytidylate kinase